MKSELVTAAGLHGTMYRVMYASRNVYNKPVAVTGVIAVPNGTPPAGGFPVVSWGHGTNGMADVCAPSLSPRRTCRSRTLLDQGWVVTASDYQGEGTPGLMPYLAGVSAARNTIDIVGPRASFRPRTRVTASRPGHSEGGQTAMFALKIGAAYAPGLQLKGVVAGAPPSQFKFIYNVLKNSPFRYYLLMAAGGLNAAYGNVNAPLEQVLTPLGLQQIPKLDKGCTGYLVQQFGSLSTASLVKADPLAPFPPQADAPHRQRSGPVHDRECGSSAHHPRRQRRADPRRLDAAARRSPVRRRTGGPTLGVSRAKSRRSDRAVGERHDPVDHAPLRPRPESGSLRADGTVGRRRSRSAL